MSETPIPLRVVIQQLGLYPVPNYRVIAYGDELKPMHLTLGMRRYSLKRPDPPYRGSMSRACLLQPLHEGQGSIVFDAEMPLSGDQRSALGLK